MKRPAFLVLAGAVILGVISNGQVLHGQGKKGRPVQKQTVINQATMLYRADAMRRQQAALAAALARQARWQQAAWHAKARQSATVVIRTSGTKKGTQPVILSSHLTSRMRGPVNEVTVRTSLPSAGPVNPQKYQFKETWPRNWGPGIPASKTRFTEQVASRGGKEVIKDKWSTKASSPALAYLPIQVQLRQLENLLPYQSYGAWFGYSQPWSGWYPAYVGGPGRKTTIQSKIRWQGGSEKVKTQIVNQYDKAGRFLGVQVRITDSPKGNAATLAPLSPQAQIYLLEAAAAPLGYYPYAVYNPLAYSWVNPYYRTDWMALERLAALEGLPIW